MGVTMQTVQDMLAKLPHLNNRDYFLALDELKRLLLAQGQVVEPIQRQASVLQGAPVAVLDENKLNMPSSGGFAAIEQWATHLFLRQGGNAINPILGEITLNHRSVKDSLAHGKFNPYKNIAFAGVKDVLEKGVLVGFDNVQPAQDSFFVAAPILINGKENVVTVTVHRDVNTQSMYLHGVMVKENLLKPRVSETQEASSRKHIGSLTSADIHNILHAALTFKQD